MKAMVHMLGQPDDFLLSVGENARQHFSREEGSTSPGWRLKTPKEYEEATGVRPHVLKTIFDIAKNLEDAVQSYPEKRDPLEYKIGWHF